MIKGGVVKLNGMDVVIDKRWMPNHFREQALESTQNKPVTQVYIGADNNFTPYMTSSQETVNEMLGEVLALVPEGPSLASVEVNYFYDKHTIDEETVT